MCTALKMNKCQRVYVFEKTDIVTFLQDAHSAKLSLNPNFQKKNQMQRPLHQVDALAIPFVKQLLKMALPG